MFSRKKLFLLIVFLVMTTSAVAGEVSREYKIKAAYIYNFAKLVRWPDSGAGVLNVCILENNDMYSAADSIKGKQVGEKTVEIKEVNNSGSLQGCDVIYFSRSDQIQLLKEVDGQPVLTMGDVSNFTDEGGIIYLFIDSNKVRFEINQKAAVQNNLEIGSQLLELAKRVIR